MPQTREERISNYADVSVRVAVKYHIDEELLDLDSNNKYDQRYMEGQMCYKEQELFFEYKIEQAARKTLCKLFIQTLTEIKRIMYDSTDHRTFEYLQTMKDVAEKHPIIAEYLESHES